MSLNLIRDDMTKYGDDFGNNQFNRKFSKTTFYPIFWVNPKMIAVYPIFRMLEAVKA